MSGKLGKSDTKIINKLILVDDAFLAEVKRHLRIPHASDDVLIENEIQVATRNIMQVYILMEPDDPNYPSSTLDLTQSQRLAVKHLVTTYRTNPDERIESRYTPQTKMLIERILGPELGYPVV